MKKYESFYKLLREVDVKEVVEAVGQMYYEDKPEENVRMPTRENLTNCCTCNRKK